MISKQIKRFYRFGHGSKAWFLKHINDIYVKKANILNYRSRASFKLLEIIKKHPNLIQSFQNTHMKSLKQQKTEMQHEHALIKNVLDLGCAPGSWSQVLLEILPHSHIVGVDLLEMKQIKGVDFYHCDARSKQLHQILLKKYGKFQLIVSDMAPNFDGDSTNTHFQILELNALCVQLCCQLGLPSCSLVMKSVQGEKQKNFFHALSSVFKNVHREKPSASRAQSIQFFYVCDKLLAKNNSQTLAIGQQFGKISLNIEVELQKYKTKKQSEKYVQNLLKTNQ